MVEPQLCVNREVCRLTHLLCTRCGQAIFNVSEICTLFVFTCALCHVTSLHEAGRQVRGESVEWWKLEFRLKIQPGTCYAFVSK